MYIANNKSHPLYIYYISILTFFVLYLYFYLKFNNVSRIMQHTSAYSDNILNETISDLEESEAMQFNVPTRQLFYVYSDQCKMPYADPFTEEILKEFVPLEYQACSNETDLIIPLYDESLQRYRLLINEELIHQKLNSVTKEFNCYYQEIVRAPKKDINDDPRARKYFTQNYIVPVHVEGMIVQCVDTENEESVLQRDAFYLIQPKINKVVDKYASLHQSPRKPSVIMMGIDSMSRINFRRTMPLVYEHLQRSGWIEMQGYNKIGDNTLPNLMAILSGYSPITSKKICDINEKGCLDRFPFIWKYFKDAGYITAYAEDEININTFNYLKPGFQEPPTDYFFRPFGRAFEKYLNTTKCSYDVCTLKYCIGRKTAVSYIYDFCRQFMQRFAQNESIFGLFWTNSVSHDSYSLPSIMEDKVLQYFLDFESDKSLDSTIMIFHSDHGMRWGRLLHLSEGFLEERLPLMFIWLPPWFRKAYPQYAAALKQNANRLTSNYDLHLTLKHIIELGAPGKIQLPGANDCLKCQSLFLTVPEDRTCTDAGIMEHWCTCNPYETVTNQKYALRIVPLVIERMNEYLMEKNLSSLCSNLTLNYAHQIDRKLLLNEKAEHVGNELDTYRIMYKVKPNGADFQATVIFNNRTEELDVNVETISRLSSYESDSQCVNDKFAKLFCICFSSIRKD